MAPGQSVRLAANRSLRCASAISRAMARPRPVPSALVVKNGSNRWPNASGARPGPVSATRARTAWRAGSPRVIKWRVPPFDMAWMALVVRLRKTPSARELVRDERQDAQDRRLISRAIPLRGSGSPCPSDKKARTMDPIGPVWRYTMRATDGLQTTINLGPVHRDDQAFSLQLSLGMSLPVPSQDEHLPDQIEAFVHQAGLQI